MSDSHDRLHDEQVREDARRERAMDEDQATPVRRGGSPLHRGDTADALRPDEPAPEPPEHPRADESPHDGADPVEGRPS